MTDPQQLRTLHMPLRYKPSCCSPYILSTFTVASVLLVTIAIFLRSNILGPATRLGIMSITTASARPTIQAEWRKALDELPATPDNIPAFFFGHGTPSLLRDLGVPGLEDLGPKGTLASFLKDFGPTLLQKYKPKGIVVLSAHWEEDTVKGSVSTTRTPFFADLMHGQSPTMGMKTLYSWITTASQKRCTSVHSSRAATLDFRS